MCVICLGFSIVVGTTDQNSVKGSRIRLDSTKSVSLDEFCCQCIESCSVWLLPGRVPFETTRTKSVAIGSPWASLLLHLHITHSVLGRGLLPGKKLLH
nr:hypothetical protein Iba_chr14bCG0470 [Ipomoea batatas]